MNSKIPNRLLTQSDVKLKRQGVEKRSERWQNKARMNEKAEFTFE